MRSTGPWFAAKMGLYKCIFAAETSFLLVLPLKILLSPLSKMFIFNLMNVTGKFNKLAGNFIEFAGIFKSSPENS